MSFTDPSPPFVQFQNGLDSMGFWPQYPITTEQPETNGQFDIAPPYKRPRSCDDNNQSNNQRAPPTNTLPVNQPIGKIFFKTRLCAKFKMGQCKNGESCNFAHGEEDLRKPPPNWQELVAGRTEDRGNGNGNWEDDERIIHRMKLCKKFYNGEECPYGERCNFLHKEPAKFRDNSARFRDNGNRESSAISIGTTGPPMVPPSCPDQYEVNKMANGGVDLSRGNSRPVYWKTKLCTKFEVTGHCPFGDKCHFAHGQAELLLPGGRPAEGEAMIVSPAPLKPAPPLANEVNPVKIDNGFPLSQEAQEKKCLLKWKVTKKINRIYGDWIDDLPLNLPNGVES